MREFTVHDFVRALEMLARDEDYGVLLDFLREVRSGVLPECLKLPLIGRDEGPCPEWPYVCDSACKARQGAAHSFTAAPPEEPTVEDLLLALQMVANKNPGGDLSRYLQEIWKRVSPDCLESPFYVRIPPPCPSWPYVCGSGCQARVGAHPVTGRVFSGPETTLGDFLTALEYLAMRNVYNDVRELIQKLRAWLIPECLAAPFIMKVARSCPEWPYVCGSNCTAAALAGRELKRTRANQGESVR
jgi:hypothetical protein